jgi:Putative collagen-binding domain of a collagenase
LVLAYTPSVRPLTVDMSKLAGASSARWYDPTSGEYIAVAGSPFANTGTRQFQPPKRNSAGDEDWILVLETTSPPH